MFGDGEVKEGFNNGVTISKPPYNRYTSRICDINRSLCVNSSPLFFVPPKHLPVEAVGSWPLAFAPDLANEFDCVPFSLHPGSYSPSLQLTLLNSL